MILLSVSLSSIFEPKKNFIVGAKNNEAFTLLQQWGTRQNKVGQTHITTPKHGEGHADHGEAQAGNQGPSVSGKRMSFLGTVPPHNEP